MFGISLLEFLLSACVFLFVLFFFAKDFLVCNASGCIWCSVYRDPVVGRHQGLLLILFFQSYPSLLGFKIRAVS